MSTIERIKLLPIERLDPIVVEAVASGFRGLSRLQTEWRSGQNRFDQPGEAIFIANDGDRIVGFCGLNRDPYLGDSTVGRVRHLYVAVDHRRRGIGSELIRATITTSKGHFSRLRLRTDRPDADAFYRSLGFAPVQSEHACTHHVLIDGLEGSVLH